MAEPSVVVGAGAAGLTVVEALRREGYEGPITLIGEEVHPPYDRPPLSKRPPAGLQERERLSLREPAALERLDIDLRLGHAARGLDLGTRRLFLDDGSEMSYSRLVVATGVRPRLPDDLANRRRIFLLRTVEDSERLAEAMHSASTMVVLGGGLLGYELAALGSAAGLSVTIVDRRMQPLGGTLGRLAGPMVAELHARRGVEVISGRAARGVSPIGAAPAAEVVLDDGAVLEADLVVGALGSHPNVEWAATSGLDLTDGVGCDHAGRAAPDVYAVGDVARWGTRSGEGTRVEHRTNATEQALAVARHIVHGEEPRVPSVPYFWTDQYGERIQVAGVIPEEAELSLVAGDLSSRRFVVTATHNGAVSGVLGWRMPKDFARHRAEMTSMSHCPV